MVSDFQIREHMAEFLNGQLSLQRFEEWLVQNTWNAHSFENQDAENLVADIEGLLARYSSAHLSLSDIKKKFSTLVHFNNVLVNYIEAWPMNKPIGNASLTPAQVVSAHW